MLLKKIIIGVLSGALLVVLIVGGVNRTMAKTSDETGTEAGAGRGRNAQSEDGQAYALEEDHMERSAGERQYLNAKEPNSTLEGSSDVKAIGTQGSNGQGNRGGNRDANLSAEPLNLAEEQFIDLVELQGSINSVNLEDAVIINVEAGQIVMEGRSLSFAVLQGFYAEPGDEVRLMGFYEDTDFEIVEILNKTSGQVISLREPTGRPLWAGGRRTW